MADDYPRIEPAGSLTMAGANRIWTHPQFLVADVCKITGTTPKALEHFVSPKRGLVRLIGAHVNPGTGRRRIFSGGQVLMIAAAYTMSRIGFPQRYVRTLAEDVERRAHFRGLPGGNLQTGMKIATYPMNEGDDWVVTRLFKEMGQEPVLPVAVHLLDVDRLIDQVKAQLEAMIADEEVPDFTVPDPEPEPSPYSPASNFYREWEKSDKGRWIYVGLSEEETEELLAMQGSEIQGDDLVIVGEGRGESERFLELIEKHERELLRRGGMDMEGDE
ncbi:hypothetical protein [Fluviibacterium sp. S390]|uniref:hypothetical protein n=1 Tax=Fluviibacterium sp. S390 TaxID=3415139 RepID=UPI003C7B8BC2